ncbi:acetate--CoA ligase family protein [Noviherbaspirillum saxi]|uniref:CoA-binding protein n=1 Tax=Noviherbaspirillum saxi TaxID=2320863 RepID=A0A3A3FJ69_9BURK|nr:acetate--CoA ligase family protein [Noviherbaspirillum saxi]RJF95533.1 CoA-binding protein [Noviherbaspirillum saxi]
MTRINESLDSFFSPRSIAVVGASATPGKIGAIPITYQNDYGFNGELYPINPGRDEIQGRKAYPTLAAVGKPIDLAIFAIPAAAVDASLDDAIAAGVKNIVMFSAGFAEVSEDGKAAQQRLIAKARAAGIRMVGPNCLGFMNIARSIYATFSPVVFSGRAQTGSIGIVSQSGAFGAYAYAMARERGLGLSVWVTTGNEADIQVADCIAWMASDPNTKVIMAYMEGCQNGERLKEALALARDAGKPVVVVKVGRTELGAAAAASHTASLAGNDAVFDALFKQYGAWRARTIEDFFNIAYALSISGVPSKGKLGLLTVSGGVGVLMADDAADYGLDVAPMPQAAQDWLLAQVPFAAPRNPVDITGQVTSQVSLIEDTARVMLRDGDYGSLIIFLAAAGLTERMQALQKEVAQKLTAEFPGRVVMFSTLFTREHQRALDECGCASFQEPSSAIRVLAALDYFRVQRETQHIDRDAVIKHVALSPGALNEIDSLALLNKFGVAGVPSRIATRCDEAVTVAGSLGFPVVMKVLSSEITHKSDVGGVVLSLSNEDSVRIAYDKMMARIHEAAPTAKLDGVLIAPMVRGGVECILGVHRDPVMGPVVMFGMGGVSVELLKDVSFRIAPVSPTEARAMVDEVKLSPLLHGYRGTAPADIDALTQAIVGLSKLAMAAGETLESIDVNPFIALPAGQGAMALDAVVIGRSQSTR